MNNPLPAWGDLGNGYYRNPILNADFSDPDVVQVGEDYYMVCSEFHFMGIPVLHSRDLVNWRLVGRVFHRLDVDPGYDTVAKYGKGSWAPALRWNHGTFYVYFCTPDEGLFVCTATDPSGPWTPPHALSRTGWWEDPCPFWDDDGRAYLGRSIVGAGPIVIHQMSVDGLSLLDEGTTVYIGKIAEGTKIYKREGWYYLVIPEGGVETGWQTVLRSKSLYGPYERRVVLATGATSVNGPHQGALVDAGGETWFLHFQSRGALGRVVHLQPVTWVEGWPVMGADGEPVELWSKPRLPPCPPGLPATSDPWEGPLGWQWQWNHNPVDEAWSLTERPGWLRLKSLEAPTLRAARNTLTQRLMGPRGRVEVDLDGAGMAEGQVAGLVLWGRSEDWVGLRRIDGRLRVEAWASGKVAYGPMDSPVGLGLIIDLDGTTRFQVRLGGGWVDLAGACTPTAAAWKGARVGLFSYGPRGAADFGPFRYDVDLS